MSSVFLWMKAITSNLNCDWTAGGAMFQQP